MYLYFCRLQVVVDQWEQFDNDASALENWLEVAHDKLDVLVCMDDVELQNVTTVRSKMEEFLV